VPAVAKVDGLNETIAYLKEFDKDTLKALNKELYVEVKKLVQQTRLEVPTQTPLRNWKPYEGGTSRWGNEIAFKPNKVRTGVRSKIGPVRNKATNTRERVYFLIQQDGAGAVYETAGRKTKGNTPQGKAFIRNIEAKSNITVIGKQGRLIWKNVIENRDEVTANLAAVVRKYEAIINAKLAK
jgi:tricorn protease-like protein